LAVTVAANVYICYRAARPVRGVGIAMPGLLAPLVSIGMTWLLLDNRDYESIRAPVAFVAGVLGPLIGADVLHLKDIMKVSAGVLSIGGAGTFDGIVLSGLFAALFAEPRHSLAAAPASVVHEPGWTDVFRLFVDLLAHSVQKMVLGAAFA
jgi:uncharacterized membrane protein